MTRQLGIPGNPVVLVILDGFGINPSKINNAIAEARTPRLDEYFFRYPFTLLNASGPGVGLPQGQMGNSEVGHMTIGSGCAVRQDLVLIDDAIADGSFFGNPALSSAAERAAAQGRPVHLMGLVSDGGVHSHLSHLLALVDLCRMKGARPLLHMITDGRDVAPKSALNGLAALETALAGAGGRIATVSGRYYAMDRDRRWERTELAWRAIARGEGRSAASAAAAVDASYAAGKGDEFIHPTVIGGYRGMDADDVVCLFQLPQGPSAADRGGPRVRRFRRFRPRRGEAG